MLVDHLPAGSATWTAQAGVPYGWTLTDVLLTDLFLAITGQEHPARPRAGTAAQSTSDKDSELRARLLAQRERLSRRTEEE